MTEFVAVVMAAVRALLPQVCPEVDRPPVVAVEREVRWPREKAHFDAATPQRIHIDPRTPRVMVRRVVRHELEHWCRFNAGRADWAMGEKVRR